MSDDSNAWEEDKLYLIKEFSRWWKIPNEKQIEMFCELVAKMVADDEFSEDDARKSAFDRVNR